MRPGEKIPLDGVVDAGRSEMNQAPITGESMPVERGPGEEVFAGTINGQGALDVRVTRAVRDTTLARIVHLVETAQAQRAPAQQFIDRFARWYTPAVVAVAAAVFFVPVVALGLPVALWGYRALVLLVVACPCALVISTPVSIVAALATAARRGVLIKGGAHLERLAGVRAVAFDKTGTLTHGEPAVVGVTGHGGRRDRSRSCRGCGGGGALRASGGAGRRARSLAPRPRRRGRPPTCARCPGLGAEGRWQRRHGARRQRPAAARARRLDAGALPPRTRGWPRRAAARCTWPSTAWRWPRWPSPTAPATIAPDVVRLLRDQGVSHVAMLTGDSLEAARPVAAAAGVSDVRAGLLPADKMAAIAEIRRPHGAVAMVGDGVNDAPALASADVGIAMGAIGSAAALESADIALMSDELQKIPYALRLSRATLANIRVNVALSIGLKAAVLVLAVAGRLHAVDGGAGRHRGLGAGRRQRDAFAPTSMIGDSRLVIGDRSGD